VNCTYIKMHGATIKEEIKFWLLLFIPYCIVQHNGVHNFKIMCSVWISEQTAIFSLYSMNWLVCITETNWRFNIIQATIQSVKVNKPLSITKLFNPAVCLLPVPRPTTLICPCFVSLAGGVKSLPFIWRSVTTLLSARGRFS